jgi:recombinational DNA repair protein RecR
MKLFQESMLDNDICRKVFLLKESLKLENKAIEICKDQDADQTTILILESSKDSIKNILETFV